jgi:hypothetical protein
MLSEEKKKNSDDSAINSGEIDQTPAVKKYQFSSIDPEKISAEEIKIENFIEI